jgi:hypothetical protein
MSNPLQGWRFVRWILPILSPVPAVIGFVSLARAPLAGDQSMGPGMALMLFFFPVSFLLALASALVTLAHWKNWPRVDRVVGIAPFCLLLTPVFLGLLTAAFRALF